MRNKWIFYGSTLAAGLASLGLHRYMMDNCFDAKGLLISGNLPGYLLLAVGAAFVAVLAAMLRTIGGNGEYAVALPKDPVSGVLMLLGGLILALGIPGVERTLAAELATAGNGGLQAISEMLLQFIPRLAASAMGVMGICRIMGKRCSVVFGGVICLFYMLMLVTNYRLWSADPQLQDYAYQLLAQVMLMLCSFHRTCCDAGVIQRKKLLATGLTAAFCAMAALSMDFQRLFFLASALWALGALCITDKLPEDPEEPEKEEKTEETEE